MFSFIYEVILHADSSDYNTELMIVDMLRYSIEHADRNLPYNRDRMLQVIFSPASKFVICLFWAL